jgi:hypothetical protein
MILNIIPLAIAPIIVVIKQQVHFLFAETLSPSKTGSLYHVIEINLHNN